MICEHLPLCAKIANKYTILRSHSHNDNGHNTGYHYVMTGYRADFPDGNTRMPNNHLYPVDRLDRLPRAGAEDHAAAVHQHAAHDVGGRAGLLRLRACAVRHRIQPGAGRFRGAGPAPAGKPRRRRGRPAAAGCWPRSRSSNASDSDQGRAKVDVHLLPAGPRPDDLAGGPQGVRHSLRAGVGPQGVRLHGAGPVRLAGAPAGRRRAAGSSASTTAAGTITSRSFPSLEKDMLPHVDRAFSALVNDLEQRGLLESTLVVMMGEMGRTPRINAQAGRDHWSMAQSVLFAGGGVKPGQVIGATDKKASAPDVRPGQRGGHAADAVPSDGRRHDQDLLHAAGPAGADRRRRADHSGAGVVDNPR